MGPMRCAIVGGNGAVGRLFAGVLADAGGELTIVDRAAEPPLDVRAPSPALAAALAGADCVVLAVPEAVALDALPHVLGTMRPGALLVDTLSVKSRFLAEVAEQAAARELELLSLNPMFAPDLGFDGRAVLAVELAPGPRSAALLALLRERGATVVALEDAAAHDRVTAALQVAPHAALIGLGMTLVGLDADLDALLAAAPPPFLALLALCARIVSGNPSTYADIQLANPYGRDTRRALTDSIAYLSDAPAIGPGHLELLLERLAERLGDAREPLAAQAAALLAQVRPPR